MMGRARKEDASSHSHQREIACEQFSWRSDVTGGFLAAWIPDQPPWRVRRGLGKAGLPGEDSGLRSGPLKRQYPGCPGEQPPESCSAKMEQAAAGAQAKDETPEEAAIFRRVLEEQEQAEEQEQREQPQAEQALSSPGPSSTQRFLEALEALEALQMEIWPVNTKASRAYFRLRSKLVQSCKPHLDRRSAIIQGIPGFWVKAVANHPQMSALISEKDEDMLSYLINLEVENFIHPNNGCKIIFFFWRNPCFRNEVIIKGYDITITGYTAFYSTLIQWFQNYECEAHGLRHHDTSVNFFNWLSLPNFSGCNRITEIINKDLWINPLKYDLSEGRTRTGMGRDQVRTMVRGVDMRVVWGPRSTF
ncbi:testis-specific Y-encoded protein 8-like [Elephas maximus indicus]|uniref:testis-specific Y-encoded protein 8-like n=1 Tax=Elephas maximus indicus TaxID=99487 RepID=UPI00211603D5|nr:testis-specific Y-encoded protein 8-like [Elephas maximus indicus]